MLLEVENDT